jgi:hypothetical protein
MLFLMLNFKMEMYSLVHNMENYYFGREISSNQLYLLMPILLAIKDQYSMLDLWANKLLLLDLMDLLDFGISNLSIWANLMSILICL